jgi:WD40 repeat protein
MRREYRLAESLDTAELDRAEDFFRAGESAEALALLARIVRRSPTHPVVPPIPFAGWMHAVTFSPDGARVAAATANPAALVRDARTWQPLGEPMLHESGLWDVAFSPDGATLATNAGSLVHLWDSGTQRLRLTLPALPHDAHRLQFSPDGRWLLATCHNGMMRFFSTVASQPASRCGTKATST